MNKYDHNLRDSYAMLHYIYLQYFFITQKLYILYSVFSSDTKYICNCESLVSKKSLK